MSSVQEKIVDVIAERNLVSHMNNSRWSSLLTGLDAIAKRIMVKPLRWDDKPVWTNRYLIPVDGYFEPLPIGPIKFSEIEWLEIEPKNNEECEKELKEVKAAFTKEGSCFKVWGYTDRGKNFI